ncbi:unnamed protein product [Trichobilharzia szidati]|nr:unnamed protein product [Trichobilharzia szidati]
MRNINLLLLLLVFILTATFPFTRTTDAEDDYYGKNEKLFYDDDDDDEDDEDDEDDGDDSAGEDNNKSYGLHYSYSNPSGYSDGQKVNTSKPSSSNMTSSKRYYQKKPIIMHKYGKVMSLGDTVKDKRYSETTDFKIRVGTDRYGRRRDYSRFKTYGRSNDHRGNMLANAFDIFGRGYSEKRYKHKDSIKKENKKEKLFADSDHSSQSVTLNASMPADQLQNPMDG